MTWVLVSNDDGVDSPALLPFAAAVEAVLELPVRVSVPDRERSWSGKAITRDRDLRVEVVDREGRRMATTDGMPADAVQLGLHQLFTDEHDGPPALVVTGINLGFNAGEAFMASSGTVWAAAEAAFAGVPAIATSTGTTDDWHDWRRAATRGDDQARRAWQRVAHATAEVVAAVVDSGLDDHCDLVSVNLPWEVTTATPRVVTTVAALRYGALFEAGEGGVHSSRGRLDLHIPDGPDDVTTDTAALRAGAVSISPVLLPRAASPPDRVVAALER